MWMHLKGSVWFLRGTWCEWLWMTYVCVSGKGENSNHPSLIHLPKLVCCAIFLLFCYILFVWFVMEFTGFLVWLLNGQLIFHQTLWCYIWNASQTKLLIKKKKKGHCTILYFTNCNSAVSSYRKERGCIVTLASCWYTLIMFTNSQN